MNTIWGRMGACTILATTIALSACGGGGGSDSATATVKPKIYVIGASYSSDGSKNGSSNYTVSGDARHVNGAIGAAIWVEVLASTLGADTPVSSTRAPTSGQSATNYARGGSYALGDSALIGSSVATVANPATVDGAANSLVCSPTADNSSGAACGNWNTGLTKYPANAYDQWLAINTALGSATPGTSDVLSIDSGGNDLATYHTSTTRGSAAGNPFISNRADVIEKIAQAAATKGFKNIVIANIPPLHKLPGIVSSLDATHLAYLSTDVTALNNAMGAKITALKAANSGVKFYLANWNTALTQVIDNSGIVGGFIRPVDGTTADESSNDYPGGSAVSATANVLWWDTAANGFKHPSAKLHKYMADNHVSQQ